jgi:chitinase
VDVGICKDISEHSRMVRILVSECESGGLPVNDFPRKAWSFHGAHAVGQLFLQAFNDRFIAGTESFCQIDKDGIRWNAWPDGF